VDRPTPTSVNGANSTGEAAVPRIVLNRRQNQRVVLRVGGLDVWVHHYLADRGPGLSPRHMLVFDAPAEVLILREELVPEGERVPSGTETGRPA
jgi:hypothetical protein